MDADVIIVGAGPAGLMLAGELCLAGVRPLVLERQPRLRETPKANGFNGQIVELLRYRGLLDRVEAASWPPRRPGSCGPVRRCASGLLTPGRSPDMGGASPATATRAPARRTRPRTRRRHTPRTRSGRGQPGRRHGDRGRARPGRAVPGDRPVPGGLRRRAQPGPRHGRDPVPRHHLSRGQPAGPGHLARFGDPAGQRRPRRPRAGPDPRGFHPDRPRCVRVRVAHLGGSAASDHRRRARRSRR